jgi:mannose-6-phosphate isomerase-like protein (cupin superfamily)
MKQLVACAAVWSGLLAASASAQATPPQPPVLAITKADIEAVLKHVGTEGAGTDRQIRVVDLGKYNVAVGVLRRGASKAGTPITAISHAQVTEVYYVVSGGGTLVTGGTMVNATPLPAAGELVKVAVGPSRTGTFQGGNQMVVSAGDVVIIPAGVPHGFTDIKEQVTYLSIRPDPEKILPVGYVHPAIRR